MLPLPPYLVCLVTPEAALAAQHGANGDFSIIALTLYRSVASCAASSALTCWVSSRVAYRKGHDSEKTDQVLVTFHSGREDCQLPGLTNILVIVLLPSADNA